MPAVELPDELWALVGGLLSPGHDRPGPPGRLRALRVLHRKSVLHVVFVWARRALNGPAWRFPARAVVRTLGRLARTARRFARPGGVLVDLVRRPAAPRGANAALLLSSLLIPLTACHKESL